MNSKRQGATFGERSALHLLSHMTDRSKLPYTLLLDLGCCGNGEVAKTLSEELAPYGTAVIGLDINQLAIEEARTKYPVLHYPNLSFILGDAQQLQFSNEFETIISISLLHLVPLPKQVVDSIFKALKPGGVAIIQIPKSFPDPLEQTTAFLIQQDKWRQYFNNFSRGCNGVPEQEFLGMFRERGFNIIRHTQFDDFENLESVDKFKSFIASWYPYLRVILAEKKEEFLNEVVALYLHFQPLQPNGDVPFRVERLEVELLKPSTSQG
ncbi:MAG: methyltransferase domain-containing protein [Parachlamydia sp.]|nr:methyltransferase domain-containing protein [Parachlamydia sp.]